MAPLRPVLASLSTCLLKAVSLEAKGTALKSFFGPCRQQEMSLDTARWLSNLVALSGIPLEIGFTLPDSIMRRVLVVLGGRNFVSSPREIVEHNHPVHERPTPGEEDCVYMMGLPSPGDCQSIITRGREDKKIRIRRTLSPFSGALYQFDPHRQSLAIFYGINPTPDVALLSHLGSPFGLEEARHPIRVQRLEQALEELRRRARSQGLTCLAREIPFDDVVQRRIDSSGFETL